MRTEDLIDTLISQAVAVRPLSSPFRRAALWLCLASPWVAMIVFVMAPRPDLGMKLSDGRYLIEQGGAVATALLAAFAAFSTGTPGRSRWTPTLPLIPLALWLASLGEGCVTSWLHMGPAGLELHPDWRCFPAIALTGAAPGAAMVMMLRQVAPLTPQLPVALGAHASAALGNAGLRLFHPQDASLMVLVWQFGSVALLTVVGSGVGGRVLRWRHAQ